eukprot:4131648-Prymnesium_polylepis.1
MVENVTENTSMYTPPWWGCTPLDTPARPAADARAPSAASTASGSRARWQRGSPSSSATAC